MQPWYTLPVHGARRGPALYRRQVSSRKREPGLPGKDVPVEQRQVVRRLSWQPSE